MDLNDFLQWGTLIVMVASGLLAWRRLRGNQRNEDADTSQKISSAWDDYSKNLRDDLAKAKEQIAQLESSLTEAKVKMAEQDFRLSGLILEQVKLRRAFEYLAREVEEQFPMAVKIARGIASGEA